MKTLNSLFVGCLIICILLSSVVCDEKFYRDTNAVGNSWENLDLSVQSSATLFLQTSNIVDSGTNDAVYAIFVGDFSLSGPHTLGPFVSGSSVNVTISLQRIIGNLRLIEYQKTGNDGWLPSKASCNIGNIHYELQVPNQWLDALDPTLEQNYGDGYEPNSQVNIPAASKLTMPVSSQYYLYSSKSILPA